MERSASESVLSHSDYHIQKWGNESRTTLGRFTKDSGEHSSLMNQTVKAAGKTPGPGKYVAHKQWDPKLAGANQGNRFPKSGRWMKGMNTVPAPSHYENKSVSTMTSIRGSDKLSSNPRVTMGRLSKGDRKSFIEKSIKFSMSLPGPATYSPVPKSSNSLDCNTSRTLEWKRQMTSSTSKLGTSKKDLASKIGPGTYTLQQGFFEEKVPAYSIPKDPCTNFLDKAVKETYIDVRAKKECPGPTHYFKDNAFNPKKISHGPIIKSSLARTAVSSYF